MRFRGTSQLRGLSNVSQAVEIYLLVYVPDFSDDALYTLSIVEGVREDCFGFLQTADTLSE
jgi:hypothetical protein